MIKILGVHGGGIRGIMGKMLVVALLGLVLSGCAYWSLVEPTLEIVDGVEKLSQPVEEAEKKKEGE